MLELDDVSHVAKDAVVAVLGAGRVSRVLSEHTTDQDDRAALQVTVILTGTTDDEVSGDTVLDTFVSIRHGLEKEGEERFPIISFATEDDLEPDADPED